MKNGRIDIGSIRREQIVEAAGAVIAERGLQNLSLSEIEKKAGMSRGQLTYYFPTKENILLAVFDRLVQEMCRRVGSPACQPNSSPLGWEWIEHLLEKVLGQGPISPVFHVLQYTFLSQISHREDFRQRLADLYESWRANLAQSLADDQARHPSARSFSPRALATLIQAMLHGLTMQAAADPQAMDREEMLDLCLDVLGTYLRHKRNRKARPAAPPHINGHGTHALKASGLPQSPQGGVHARG